MSDLRTELLNKVVPKLKTLEALNFDDPDQPITAPVEMVQPDKLTNNEIIFNYLKDHPASYARDISDALEKQITPSSTMSQLFNLASRGLLHKVECSSTGLMMYSTAVAEYPRSTRASLVNNMFKARAALPEGEMGRRIKEGHKKKKEGEADMRLETVRRRVTNAKKSAPEPVAAVSVTPVDLNTLSIVQARKLYDELKQIFGA